MPENITSASLRLQSAHEIINTCSTENLRLYLIQRVPAPGVPKSRRTLNKYSYEAQRIDIEADVAGVLLQDAQQDLGRILRTPELEFFPTLLSAMMRKKQYNAHLAPKQVMLLLTSCIHNLLLEYELLQFSA